MTRLRADMVCEKALSEVAKRLEIGEALRLGKGEEQGGGRCRPSILADATEAVLAAVYLDGGYAEAKRLIYANVIDPFEQGDTAPIGDYKTKLQELIQRVSGNVLTYEEKGESGPDHRKSFTVAAVLNGKELARGTGKSKKEAEQLAAKLALQTLG